MIDWSSFWGAFIGNIADVAIIFILLAIVGSLYMDNSKLQHNGMEAHDGP